MRVVGTEIAAGGTLTPAQVEVAMRPWQLPVMREVRVVIGKSAEPLAALGTEPEPEPVEAMPVPVLRESC
jgi:hypothetical protein